MRENKRRKNNQLSKWSASEGVNFPYLIDEINFQ